ncbi:uncharacterized protein THITE_2115853 [Thermothielavioides terrestris NRRL 8126]|uniref:Major facilitator superfamily (MFS) profile domain-containing protein n=1 Tax=Thermothielavioides terrestris (strain ATCC 38088 / NRRL 8126) TaxID=578455 RepID=G2QYI3_THETT|nr:uncharacterized protein THITE_2115853 [Thermothielavioides terrestris NRRL 8126]AEO67078.1 hypothetical protein THITE_2115853 [Thermothielavioides terrestris NRRL 8126]
MASDRAGLAPAAPDGGEWAVSGSSSASSSSSSSSAVGRPTAGRRLTPETGSEDEDEDEDDNEHNHYDDGELVGVEKGEGDEEWELQGGADEKHGEARRQSDERQPLQRPRRRRLQLYTAEEEKAVVAKFDRRLVVFMAVLYLLSFVDRSNIGNARVAGMDDDLQSVPPRDDWYEWSLGAFYLAYIVFEWMSMLWRLIPAHIYVAALVLSWGVTASLQAVAVNYPMLIVLRTLLGVGEAGFTGVPFYLSFFFKRDELAFRTAIFVSGMSPPRPAAVRVFLE